MNRLLELKEVRFEKSSESKVEEYAHVAMEFVQQTRACGIFFLCPLSLVVNVGNVSENLII